jgi:ATP-dependent RNA helicase DeaD
MPFPATHPALERALAERDYTTPTSVQEAVLQPDAFGRDLLVSAQTGSGKTVAFGLAFAYTLMGEAALMPPGGAPLALVVAPTRELAMQVHGELEWLYAHAGARVVACVGGMDPRREARLMASGCHIVVGTPGRLRDHLARGQLDSSALRVVVLDEADEMLDLGFREDLEFILDATPADRRTLLFSATIAKEIAGLARQYQKDALRIDTVARNQPHGDIEYRAIRVNPGEVEHALVNVLRYQDAAATLVFCATRDNVRHLHVRLQERGFSAVALSGEMSQTDRTHALQALRDGRARVCVATDVAARGLDLPDLGLVVHADLPTNRATLLHRSGRTGRAGRKGTCVVLVPGNARRRMEIMFAGASIAAIWANPPSAEEIRARDQEKLLLDPALTNPPEEDELAQAQPLLAGRTAEQLAVALVRLHRDRMPAPEDLFTGNRAPVQDQGRESSGGRFGPDGGRRTTDTLPPDTAVVWFRLNVGRRNNADPKWLLPLICRLGHVTRHEIGTIRILDRETNFEIVESSVVKFTTALAKSGETEVVIEPVVARLHAPARQERGAVAPGAAVGSAPGPAAKPDRAAKPAGGHKAPFRPGKRPTNAGPGHAGPGHARPNDKKRARRD